jgi:hypothetical protein
MRFISSRTIQSLMARFERTAALVKGELLLKEACRRASSKPLRQGAVDHPVKRFCSRYLTVTEEDAVLIPNMTRAGGGTCNN